MQTTPTPLHYQVWPKGLPYQMTLPETTLCDNLEVSARRFPNKAFLVFYDSALSYRQCLREVETMAGFLQQRLGVKKGDRVLLDMQNSPSFVVAYYAILRAGAVVVPINPMNLSEELRHYPEDADATVAIIAQELYPQWQPLLGHGVEHLVVACYADYLNSPTTLNVPDWISAPQQRFDASAVHYWRDAQALQLQPRPLDIGPDDLCVMPYTSGTTGRPKGCMHTHRTCQSTLMAGIQWFGLQQDSVFLAVVPFFHVTGMQGAMSGPMFAGATVVLLPRWDRDVAAQCIARYRVSAWTAVPAMVMDFLANPNLSQHDISTITRMSGGGAAMPEAVAQRLLDLGIVYVEGYGLSETIAPSHINPPQAAKKQCLGIPLFGVESIVVDPDSLQEMPNGEVGEILIRGPQVFLGYWRKEQATAEAFVEVGGRRFFRSGDLGYRDDEGYFFMVDRLKRMINASGYKVWPTEVENLMYAHPAIQEACVIATLDSYRGESVKALVVLRQQARGNTSEDDILRWCSEHMAAYKAPKTVVFVDSLPRSGSGKVMWRALQEEENARCASTAKA